MTGLEAVESIARNCFRSFSGLSNARLVDSTEAYGVITDIPLTFCNGIATTRIVDGEAGIERVMAPFRERGRSFRWWISPSTEPADLAARLAARGLRHVFDSAGMAADLTGMPEVGQPDGLTIVRIRDEAAMHSWANILCSVFNLSAADCATWIDVFSQIGFGDEAQWAHFVGFLEGIPVATTSLLMAGELAGIYHVATMPQARGRGVGAAVTDHAMRHAREQGARQAALQSSELGFNVYRSLGFEHVCDLTLYDWRVS
jgi:ribosomal protein S18 acetylase RimI-like enzyme